MLLSQFISGSAAALEALYPPGEARSLVLRLCEELLGVKSYTHVVEPGFSIPDDRLDAMNDAVRRLRAGEPLQYVTGSADFYGRRFHVSPGVLIPRPETEILVREAVVRALSLPHPARILELCTGSGCIAWSLALEVPGALVDAVDISEDALETARAQEFSAADGNFTAPVFRRADILEVPEGGKQYDILLANPPYIRESEKVFMHPNVLEHEPELALFVPDEDPLVFYRAISSWARRFLVPGGWGMTEINEDLGDETAQVFTDAGLEGVKKMADFYGKDRFVTFQKAL